MNKTANIIKIIALTILIIFCCNVLSGFIGGNGFWGGFAFNNSFFPHINIGGHGLFTESDPSYSVASDKISLKNISSIDVDWTSGSVKIEPNDSSDEVVFYESHSADLSDKKKMVYKVTDGQLKIRYWDTVWGISLPFDGSFSKALTIKIPKNLILSDLDIDSAASTIDIKGIELGSLDINGVSGKIEASDITARTLDIESVSSSISLTNLVTNEADVENVSGSVEVDFKGMPRVFDANTVSGRIKLYFPENDGFTLSHSSVSGSVKCDFPTESSKKYMKYKNGSAEIDLETVSGSISVLKRDIK